MSFVLFSPVEINAGNDSLRLRLETDLQWTHITAPHGVYPTLEECLAALNRHLESSGYGADLVQVPDLAGLAVVLARSDGAAFRLDMPENGMHAVLGFAIGEHAPGRPAWSSENAPKSAWLGSDIASDSGELSTMNTALASPLSGMARLRRLSVSRGRSLRFTLLSSSQLDVLADLWSEAMNDGRPLYLAENWRACLESEAHRRLKPYRLNPSVQSEFAPERIWPAPQPARYDVQLVLEAAL